MNNSNINSYWHPRLNHNSVYHEQLAKCVMIKFRPWILKFSGGEIVSHKIFFLSSRFSPCLDPGSRKRRISKCWFRCPSRYFLKLEFKWRTHTPNKEKSPVNAGDETEELQKPTENIYIKKLIKNEKEKQRHPMSTRVLDIHV